MIGLDEARTIVRRAVEAVTPSDEREGNDRERVLAWIDSGALLFRTAKPDVPPMHLVSYVVVVDQARRKLLLCDHRKSGLWLPIGGHVELDEDPRIAAVRETDEEIKLKARFASYVGDVPLFVTVTATVGPMPSHTDVSLWYIVEGDAKQPIDYDRGEFKGVRWFGFDEVFATDLSTIDPELPRFTRKLVTRLDTADAS